MQGGDGDDLYYVDNSADETVEVAAAALPARRVVPLGSGSNIDTVIAQVSYTLRANVENLQLAGNSDLVATGNGLDNLLGGNTGANLLKGLAGVDILDGGAGNDTLDGGADADTLAGGSGNDTYVVDGEDELLENAGQGSDLVQTASSWTLASNFERLELTGSSAADGTGNTAANALGGNSAANTLIGLEGADTLSGLGGKDVLRGGNGNDTLTGGSEADVFVFDTALSASANRDTVADFASGSDRLQLAASVFGAFAGSSTVLAKQLLVGASATAATTADHRLIYNTTTGELYYDSDGTGPANAVQFAVLGASTHPMITAADFLIVA
jgi:Ca2+-binding RTX toxin-like protein